MANQTIKNPTLFLAFASPFQELTLLQTGLLDKLISAGNKLVLFVRDQEQEGHLRDYFKTGSVRIVVLKPVAGDRFLARIIKSCLIRKNFRHMPPEKKKRLVLQRKKTWQGSRISGKVKIIFTILISILAGKNLLNKVLNSFCTEPEINQMFQRYAPKLVMFSWGGAYDIGFLLHRSAKKFRCRTISLDASWDMAWENNWLPAMDKTLVWNRYMQQEILEQFGGRRNQVPVKGILRCHYYTRPEYRISREQFLDRFSLENDKKVVLLAPNPGWSIPDSFSDLKTKIISACNKGIINHPVQVMIRESPFYLRRGLISKEHIIDLVSQLEHSDVIVSILSTIILESSYFDTANISLAFKPFQPLYQRDFIQPFLKNKGFKLVRDEAEFFTALDAYLTDPAQDRPGRQELLDEFCSGGKTQVLDGYVNEIQALINTNTL